MKNYIICTDGTRAHVGDKVQVDVPLKGVWRGFITYISSDCTRFVINGITFDNSLNIFTIELLERGCEVSPDPHDTDEPSTLKAPEPDPREEINDLKERIKELEKKAKDLERYETYAKAADEMAAVRQAFINKGFSKTESFALLRDIVKKSYTMMGR